MSEVKPDLSLVIYREILNPEDLVMLAEKIVSDLGISAARSLVFAEDLAPRATLYRTSGAMAEFLIQERRVELEAAITHSLGVRLETPTAFASNNLPEDENGKFRRQRPSIVKLRQADRAEETEKAIPAGLHATLNSAQKLVKKQDPKADTVPPELLGNRPFMPIILAEWTDEFRPTMEGVKGLGLIPPILSLGPVQIAINEEVNPEVYGYLV